jgi:hypothetical protein
MAQLQRKDLAKEFSLIVQQEIKNHNDLLLATNMSLDEFRRQLLEMKAKYDKESRDIDADISLYSNALINLEDSLKGAIQAIQRDVNDSALLNKEQLKALRKSLDDRESYFLTLEGFETFKKKIDQWVANIERAFNQQKDVYSQEISKISEKLQNLIDLTRISLEKSIQKESEERLKQEKTLDIFAINFDSLKREIEIIKKRCFIIEKNVENIYTQIERSKAAK